MRPETWLTLVGAVGGGGLVGLSPGLPGRTTALASAATVSGCSVTDGDTIRCGSERVRLLGIDAPELPGHCRGTRICAPGDPWASTSSLKRAMSGTLRINRVGEDRYGRTLAMVASEKGDLSCWQLRHGQAIYKPAWDNGLRVARTCPRAAISG